MHNLVDEQNQRIARHIREHDWHCLQVFAEDPSMDAFSYTIGLHERFGAPEVIVFGLEKQQAHGVLSRCVERLRDGHALLTGLRDGEILRDGYGVVFKPLRREHYDEYVGTALRYYADAEFAALVMFLPDREHRFAWDIGYVGPPAREALAIV